VPILPAHNGFRFPACPLSGGFSDSRIAVPVNRYSRRFEIVQSGHLSQQVCQQTRSSPLWKLAAPRTVRKYNLGRDALQFHAGESAVVCKARHVMSKRELIAQELGRRCPKRIWTGYAPKAAII